MFGKLLFTEPTFAEMLPTNSYYEVGPHRIRINLDVMTASYTHMRVHLLCISSGWQLLFDSSFVSISTKEEFQQQVDLAIEQTIMLLDGE